MQTYKWLDACLSDQGSVHATFEISEGIKATPFDIKEREVKAEKFQSQIG